MKYDKEVLALMQSVYIIAMLLPVVPDGVVRHFDSVFDALIQLIEFTYYNAGL